MYFQPRMAQTIHYYSKRKKLRPNEEILDLSKTEHSKANSITVAPCSMSKAF